ncbi:MAG: hypothetical protein IT379_39975 [Deltaproteobacteria bacterium]|nr:hypothetical protein [Deltaproteobacteria bacterium]
MGSSVWTAPFSARSCGSCVAIAIFLLSCLGPRWAGSTAAALDRSEKQEIRLPSRAETLRAQRTAASVRDRYLEDRDALMVTLAAWAAGSITSGVALWAGAEGDRDERRALGVQHVAWGTVNLGLAAVALIRTPIQRASARRHEGIRSPLDASELVTAAYWRGERGSLRSIFWWNAALDVLYVTTGLLLHTLGESDWVRGTGTGVLIQGAWLALFDSGSALFVGARDL